MGIEPMSSIVIKKSSTSLAYFYLRAICLKISKKQIERLFEVRLFFCQKENKKMHLNNDVVLAY